MKRHGRVAKAFKGRVRAPEGGSTAGDNSSPAKASFPIVGIGASAGGLEAFTHLLKELPSDTGMAFILIQHLDATHASFLAEALSKATTMPVCQAEDRSIIRPDHVYVIPPKADLALIHGLLSLVPRREETGKLHLPIDSFFRSLAEDRGSHAIGVVLSGTASDGTEGLRAIKAENGITLAQSPKSAKFDGMPHSAINARVVDHSLALPELAKELVRLSRHPYFAASPRELPKKDVSAVNRIYAIVRNSVGVDFSEYKRPTFERRLARRMALRHADRVHDYLAILEEDPEEIRSLYEDLLIHVTSFFRDPQVFESLKAKIFPKIVKKKRDNASIRIWVAGCSTGEEAYSIAIALLEFLEDAHLEYAIQIFGSDVSEKAIEKARLGVYPDAALRDVSNERRRRYFSKVETGYRINKSVRDLCVFVRHDLSRDPPFSKLDLASCRNVLIYFDAVLQKRVVPTLHYALNQPGFLLLGRSESIAGFGQLFAPIDKRNKVFARTVAPSNLRFAPRSEVYPSVSRVISHDLPEGSPATTRGVDLGKQLDRMLVGRYAPPGVLIDGRMDILQFRGETGDYLQAPPGEPQNNLLKMARGGLLSELRATIARAKKRNAPATAEAVEFDSNGSTTRCDISVTPFNGPRESTERLFVVMFENATSAKGAKPSKSSPRKPETLQNTRRVSRLEHELAATKEYLQSLVEEHSRSNDDINSANEELISSNEELQSLNEELETAKEEFQSTNEELTTVNDELHGRNQEVGQVNSDLLNLLATVDVPILILDADLRIRRVTPKARTILNVLPSDVGRPLDDIRVNIDAPSLSEQIREVIDTNTLHESEVQDRDGRWHRMQIRPYKTTDNRIEGATLSLFDIDDLKHHVNEAQVAKAEAENANRAKDQFLATLSHELRTPLATILIYAQMLRREDMDPKLQRAGESIERCIQIQAQLIDDLLDVSRIVAGKLKIELEPVDLRGIVKAALDGASAVAERKSIKLNVDLDMPVGQVSADPVRLQQVVSNLLTNAVKFTPEGGRVAVALDLAEGRARLRVSDNGIGIAANFLPHVFNRFSQQDGSTTRRHGGLGLGLAIVHHLVEAHRGTVTAESPGTGKGATFTVTLPLMSAPWNELDHAVSSRARSASLRTDEAPTESLKLGRVRILVVDDDLATREAVADLLRETGATVQAAASASEAMRAVEEFKPEVLLCDIAMPGEDGNTFIRRVRALSASRGGHTPALALSARAGEEDRREALSAGFQMHLAKPIDIGRLAAAVRELRATANP